MTWISKIKKYKRLDKRERKVYNSKLLASRNIFFDTIGYTIYSRSH